MINKIWLFFGFTSGGNARSNKIKKNITASFLVKGVSIVIGFLMVPLCLNYLDQTRYGIWLTMSSFLGWFSFFEIGLGAGLRNKLAESLAIKDFEKGKIYVSTTYAILSIVIIIVALIFLIANQLLDWTRILNTDQALYNELRILALIVFNFFFLRFILKLIGIILYADQRPALANSLGPIANLISLLIIYILTKTTNGSLIYLGTTLSIAPVFVMLCTSTVLFSGKYKALAPSFRFIRFRYAKNLLNLGVNFFLIQISGLVMFQTSNIIIAQFFGPAEVTPYNIAYRLFSTMNMVFAIIVMPFWSAFTEAWTVRDIVWIKRSINKLLRIWLMVALAGIVILIFSPFIYKLWVGESICISFPLSALLMIYFALFAFGGVFNMFINGVGKIKLQLYSSIAGALLFLPLSYLFLKIIGMGIEGLVLATIITNFYGPVLAPVQYKKIITAKAYGTWSK